MNGRDLERLRRQLHTMSDRLVVEYAGRLPAATVIATVARVYADGCRAGNRDPGATEQKARARLAELVGPALAGRR